MSTRPKNDGLVYLRRSTSKQETGIHEQLAWAVAEAAKLGVHLDAQPADLHHMLARGLDRHNAIYLDDGISGSDMLRPAFCQFRRDALERKRVSHLFVHMSGRFARPEQATQAMILETELTLAELIDDADIIGLVEYGKSSGGTHRRFDGSGPRTLTDADRKPDGEARVVANPKDSLICAPAQVAGPAERELFDACQTQRERRAVARRGITRLSNPGRYPLSLRVHDLTPGCRQPLYGRKDRERLVYVCSKYMRSGAQECHHNSVDAEAALSFVLDALRQRTDPTARGEIPQLLKALNVNLWLRFGELSTRGRRVRGVTSGILTIGDGPPPVPVADEEGSAPPSGGCSGAGVEPASTEYVPAPTGVHTVESVGCTIGNFGEPAA